jgi:hypothetical protein
VQVLGIRRRGDPGVVEQAAPDAQNTRQVNTNMMMTEIQRSWLKKTKGQDKTRQDKIAKDKTRQDNRGKARQDKVAHLFMSQGSWETSKSSTKS